MGGLSPGEVVGFPVAPLVVLTVVPAAEVVFFVGICPFVFTVVSAPGSLVVGVNSVGALVDVCSSPGIQITKFYAF